MVSIAELLRWLTTAVVVLVGGAPLSTVIDSANPVGRSVERQAAALNLGDTFGVAVIRVAIAGTDGDVEPNDVGGRLIDNEPLDQAGPLGVGGPDAEALDQGQVLGNALTDDELLDQGPIGAIDDELLDAGLPSLVASGEEETLDAGTPPTSSGDGLPIDDSRVGGSGGGGGGSSGGSGGGGSGGGGASGGASGGGSGNGGGGNGGGGGGGGGNGGGGSSGNGGNGGGTSSGGSGGSLDDCNVLARAGRAFAGSGCGSTGVLVGHTPLGETSEPPARPSGPTVTIPDRSGGTRTVVGEEIAERVEIRISRDGGTERVDESGGDGNREVVGGGDGGRASSAQAAPGARRVQAGQTSGRDADDGEKGHQAKKQAKKQEKKAERRDRQDERQEKRQEAKKKAEKAKKAKKQNKK